jgi:hypothetical protein
MKVKKHTRVIRQLMLFSLISGLTAVTTSAGAAVTTRLPVHFSISNPPCPSVPATVTGDGEAQVVTHAKQNADGTYEISMLEVLQGRATDSNGTKYVFHDIDHLIMNSSSMEPLPPYTLRGTGNIALISLGKSANIQLKMYVNWQYNIDGTITDLGSVYEGDISCDPSTQL